MLNVRILKVVHSGDEWKKLIPHIGWADVFSPESAGVTEKQASKEESRLKRLGNISLEEFIQKEKKQDEYVFQLKKELFLRKKPIYFLERLSPEEFTDIFKLKADSELFLSLALDCLKNHESDPLLDSFMQNATRYFTYKEIIRNIRDINIGKNIDLAEERIRRIYSIDKDEINLAMIIGSSHKPERNIKVKPEVINLYEDKPGINYLIKTISEHFYNKKDPEEIRKEIITWGYFHLGMCRQAKAI